jgi:hypothetical protein
MSGLPLAMRAVVLLAAAVVFAVALKGDPAVAASADRKVLEGVPKVDHDTHFCSLTGAVESVMKYRGDPTDYDYLMGVTGLAFRRLWSRDDLGSAGPMRFAPEAVRRAFWALGYDYEILAPTQGRAALLRALRESLAKGRPLLAAGIVGPPECEIVTGYSQGGEVLHGWSEFQDHEPWRQFQDPSVPGYYAKPDWYEEAQWANGVGLIVIGDRKPGPLPARREVLLSSLKWAIQLERAETWPGIADHSAGLAAYADWAKAIEVDADYPKEDAKVMETRHLALMDQAVMVEERGNGARFLRQMADAAPEATDILKAAADLYEQVGSEAGPVYPWGPDWAKPDLADPTVRREVAKHIRTAAEKETQAVALLERAVAAIEEAKPMAKGGAHMLEGIAFPKHTAAEMACVEGSVRYLGKDISTAWIYGGTGHAFAINMRPTVCVSSPYAWEKTLYELAPNLGFRVTGFTISKSAAGDAFPARQREAWDMVRAAIDRGQPCYADRVYWMPDYALITGYDDVGYYYAHGDDRGGPTPWQKLGTEDIAMLDVWRVELCEGKPDGEVVRAALETVLARAATPHGWTTNRDQASGPWAFDLWADELASGHALRDSHAYNACFWAEYREMAVAFLEEAKRRLPGRCDAAFDEATTHYSMVRDKLAEVARLTPNRDDANWTDTLRSPESAELIRQAGAEERQGLVALAKIVRALGGTVPAAADPRPQETAVSKRFVLQGVPKVAYHTDRWRFTPFCNALDAALRYLGQPEQYDYLMCTSGAMFRMTWHPKAWDQGNSDILGMAEQTLEPMRRAFRSAGYEMRAVAKAEPAQWAERLLHDDAQRVGGELTGEGGFRRRIVESINAGRPVIAFGVVGPPEACLITGYDERGDVLIGWNVFQDEEKAETEPSGYFRVRNWYPTTRGLLLFGDQVGKPDPKELDRDTLEWALRVLRTPRVRNGQAGPAAFDAWAADMRDDASFPKGDLKVLHDRLMCHWDSMTITATRGSGSATAYLLDAAKRHPAAAEELRAAADCLDREDVVHGVAPGEEAHLVRLADPKVRREVADSILRARDMHVQAADHIEKALAELQ